MFAKQDKIKNVINEVVSTGVCCGCGICAGICPLHCLSMRFNEHGEYNPFNTEHQCVQCGLCLKTCPFFSHKDNEDTLGNKLFASVPGIQHAKETGYYLDSYIGHATLNGHRENGASGGLATWLLETLLLSKTVDAIICVRSRTGGHPFFEFTICQNADELRNCSRSSYYPVEISSIIQLIFKSDKQYAIIALPCLCKGLRLATQNLPLLSKRLKYVFGLVCGQTKSSFFVESICAMNGGNAQNLQEVRFRIKDPARPSSDYGLSYRCTTGNQNQSEGIAFWSEGMNKIWLDRYFTPLACDLCDDVFAECADVTFMDAWLPKYSRDWQGHSIMLIRNAELAHIAQNTCAAGCALERIDVKTVLQSQQGVIETKRKDILHRIQLAQHLGAKVTVKRRHLFSFKPQIGKRSLVTAQWDIARSSGRTWVIAGGDFALFQQMNESQIRKIATTRRMMGRMRYPNAVLKRLFRG